MSIEIIATTAVLIMAFAYWISKKRGPRVNRIGLDIPTSRKQWIEAAKMHGIEYKLWWTNKKFRAEIRKVVYENSSSNSTIESLEKIALGVSGVKNVRIDDDQPRGLRTATVFIEIGKCRKRYLVIDQVYDKINNCRPVGVGIVVTGKGF